MNPRIASIQVGSVQTSGSPGSTEIEDRCWTSAFDKQPIAGPVVVTTLGIVGDAVADTENHGGPDKAILCYASSHYSAWQASHPQHNMMAGGFGENLTVEGLDEWCVCIGDRYETEHCSFEVSQPRQPCWKISRRWADASLTKAVAQSGRTGWYLRVLTPGQLSVGEVLTLTHRPHPTWTVGRANDVLFGRLFDRLSVMELMRLPELSSDWKASIA
jgi:MOSC domain-containing protein YiiM